MKTQSKSPSKNCAILLSVFAFLCSPNLIAASNYDNQFVLNELERARSNPDNSTMLEVAQPVELVFDALLTRLAEYTDNVATISFDHSAAQSPGVLGVGSERITTMDDGKRLVQRILIFEPPNTFAYFTDMAKSTISVPIDYSIGYYEFSKQQDGRVNAAVSVVYRPSSRLTAFLVRLGFNRALSRDFQKAEEYLNSLARED